jgi:long-chain acyl-CoA synthetase
LAAVLVAAGVSPGDRVIISAENRPEWAICDLAIMSIGAIVVPAYTTNTEDDHHFIMDHSGAVVAITSGGALATRMMLAATRAPQLRLMIFMDPTAIALPDSNIETKQWDDAVATAEPLATIDQRIDAQKADDTCCLIYTSGTGGRPKGVMLTHRSIQANIDAAIMLLEEANASSDQRFLSLLPLSHSYEHTAGLHLPLQTKSEVWYSESAEQIAANLLDVSPTLMTAVPRLYDVLHERIMRGVRSKGGISARLFHETIRLGRKRLAGRHLLPHEFILNLVLEKFVRQKVRARLGGRLAYFISGGAPLNPDVGSFFMALGVKLLQGYGQTEASPLISANRPNLIKIDTVGPPVDGVELRLSEDGEILVRGDMLMKGYWRDPATTAGVIKDGWLYTGDLGSVDEDGYVTITGRKKDIIVNSGGENIAPGRVEALLAIEPEIEQVMVDGDHRPWLAGVIVPSDEARAKAASDNDLKTLIAEAVDRANTRLSQIERVRRFVIAKEAFSTENSQLTPTLKVRRHIVRAAYADQLDALYKRR